MTEWNATDYAERATLQAAMAAEVLALLQLKGDEAVLDIGCGDGKVTARIADRLPHGSVVGVDASRQMVEFASSHFGAGAKDGQDARANLRFAVADARTLPFHDQFDLVVSFNALHWVPDQETALHAIRTALKPDGHAQLRLVPRGERKSLEDVLEETRKSAPWKHYFHDFQDPYLHLSPEEYAALAEKCGLQVLRTNVSAKAWDFQSRDAFFALGSVTFVEWSRRVPEKEQAAFIHDVLDRYQSVACDRPGEEHVFRFYQMDITLERT